MNQCFARLADYGDALGALSLNVLPISCSNACTTLLCLQACTNNVCAVSRFKQCDAR